ncbi:MAG TPA: lytic transglycosylase domain-containing protein [Terriglobales bacterium]|nr:lytic transglycosylase domain-containing protein [Terriglobales bacterium]
MRKRLQLALMANVVAAFLSLTPYVQAQHNTAITTTTDDYGRVVYVNESVQSIDGDVQAPMQRTSLAFWSAPEHRWKTVPSAHVRAARSAAAEVNQYLDSHETTDIARTSAFNRVFAQQDIDNAIELAAQRHNVDPNLVRAVIKVESNFNPNAVSRKGAMGLMQLMPQTARQLNVENPFDPEQNVDAGVRHLKHLMESFGGDVKLTLAAYNAGAGAVARSAGVPRIAETRNYVKRITQLYYSGFDPGARVFGSPVHEPIHVQRDARGVLYISNTD